MQLSFLCTNTDGDGVCDTLDRCSTIVGAQEGCPDLDRDGVLDAADRCKTIVGTDPDGCPPEDRDGIVNALDMCVAQQGYPPSGCPDGDGDRVFYPSDACPTEKGIAPNGCADVDGDGFSRPNDPCPTVFGLPNGCLGMLDADINWRFVLGRSYRLKCLRVKALVGSKIEVRCSARKKSHCPFTSRTFAAKVKPLDIKSAFRNRSLRGRPFTLTFRVTKRGYLGTYKRYSFNGGSLRSTERCIQTNGTLKKCPS